VKKGEITPGFDLMELAETRESGQTRTELKQMLALRCKHYPSSTGSF
jgi:hypothetical protein